MFKKRAKAKQLTGSTSTQRSTVVSKQYQDAPTIDQAREQEIADGTVRPTKLSIEEVRARYGEPLELQGLQTGPIAYSDLSVSASPRAPPNDPKDPSKLQEIDQALDEAPDDEWEAEQLRKVGVTATRLNTGEKKLEDVVSRLKSRLNALNQRAEDLEQTIKDFETAL